MFPAQWTDLRPYCPGRGGAWLGPVFPGISSCERGRLPEDRETLVQFYAPHPHLALLVRATSTVEFPSDCCQTLLDPLHRGLRHRTETTGWGLVMGKDRSRLGKGEYYRVGLIPLQVPVQIPVY